MRQRTLFAFLIALLPAAGCKRDRPLFKLLSADQTGVTFANTITTTDSLNVQTDVYVYNGAGVAVGDIDNDGLSDIFFAGNMVSSRLYRNKGDMRFEDITQRARVGTQRWATGATMVDFNNDGFLDLIIPCHGLSASRGPFVYLNHADGTFTDIRATSGIKKATELDSGDWHGISFGDYDGDGNLDVYIAEGAKRGVEVKRDLLYKGNGDGTFTYASTSAQIEASVNRGRCSFFFDHDKDGKVDLFVKNYDGSNRLYRGNGDGTFTQLTDAAGLDAATLGRDFGSIMSFADYDNDGFLDVAITGDGDTEALYRNLGDGTYADVTSNAGLVSRDNGKGMAWGDYNNDGLLDLCIARGHQGTAEPARGTCSTAQRTGRACRGRHGLILNRAR